MQRPPFCVGGGAVAAVEPACVVEGCVVPVLDAAVTRHIVTAACCAARVPSGVAASSASEPDNAASSVGGSSGAASCTVVALQRANLAGEEAGVRRAADELMAITPAACYFGGRARFQRSNGLRRGARVSGSRAQAPPALASAVCTRVAGFLRAARLLLWRPSAVPEQQRVAVGRRRVECGGGHPAPHRALWWPSSVRTLRGRRQTCAGLRPHLRPLRLRLWPTDADHAASGSRCPRQWC